MMKVLISLIRFVYFCAFFKIRFPGTYTGKRIQMEDGKEFEIFRHMKLNKEIPGASAVLIVRFRFRRFSHTVNKRLSCIPVPLIAGFPGFRNKIWMIDYDTGLWQGVYQFADTEAVDKYTKSFVLKMMNKRAVKENVNYRIFTDCNIESFIKERYII